MYLTSDDLTIRFATIDDAVILSNWWNNGKIMAHAGFPNGIHSDSTELKEKIRNANDSFRILILEIDSRRVGEMSYKLSNKIAKIGIKICDFWYLEKGYGPKALQMLISYLFEEKGIEKIVLDTNLDNLRAQHVYEKIGFKKTAVHINSWKDQLGVLQSSVDYELNKEDFFCSAMH